MAAAAGGPTRNEPLRSTETRGETARSGCRVSGRQNLVNKLGTNGLRISESARDIRIFQDLGTSSHLKPDVEPPSLFTF